MKYILICTATLIFCFGIGFIIARLLTRKSKSKKKLKSFALTVAFGLLIMILTTLSYMSIYYHAETEAISALEKCETVSVQKIDGGYFFDGKGTDKALIFYPGAKVECEAYANLMVKLSENGIDCFLADVPFNFAIFGGNFADKFINEYNYETWIMSGHSMGGLVASNYTAEHTDKIDGLALLASYATNKVAQSVKLISIYGSRDGCLNIEEYQKDKINWPKDSQELIIDGGNHAQFANYGKQKGDNESTITAEEQQSLTANAIADFFKN